MSSLAIQVTGLGKQYRIGAKQQRYLALRDVIVDVALGPYRRLRSALRGEGSFGPAERFWALKDVSFEVRHGEVIGIIGRNGAGKSTLLKILSRITEPTTGCCRIHGRVGSLLEVGTGFHPELTGRENIYLNGAVLGMRRSEIARKFDAIVAFAEVEQFVDTMVKHYSSGMYLRLAFAVAAHLEPEILLVDEVLAVGDAAFQKKCLNKMESVGREGRTVFFVSHSMPAIARLCDRVLLFDQGQIVQDGPAHLVTANYLTSGLGTRAAREWPDPARAPGNDVVRLRAVRVRDAQGRVSEAIDVRSPVVIELEYDVLRAGVTLAPWFTLLNDEGAYVFSAIDQHTEWRERPRAMGRYVSQGLIPANLLSEGLLIVSPAIVTIHPRTVHLNVREAVAFQVIDRLEGDSARGNWAEQMVGAVRPLLSWKTVYE